MTVISFSWLGYKAAFLIFWKPKFSTDLMIIAIAALNMRSIFINQNSNESIVHKVKKLKTYWFEFWFRSVRIFKKLCALKNWKWKTGVPILKTEVCIITVPSSRYQKSQVFGNMCLRKMSNELYFFFCSSLIDIVLITRLHC